VKMMAGGPTEVVAKPTPSVTPAIVVRPTASVVETPPVVAAPGELAQARAGMTSSDPDLRARSAATFGKLADKEATPDLVTLAADPDARVRARAIWALGRIKDPRAEAATIAALRDEDRSVVAAAIAAVDGSADVKIVEPLQAVEAKYATADPALAAAAAQTREKVFSQDGDRSFGDRTCAVWRTQLRDGSTKLQTAKARLPDADRTVRYYRQRYGFDPAMREVPATADVETKHVFRTVYAAGLRSLAQAQSDLKNAEGAQTSLIAAADAAQVPAECRR